MAARSPAVNEWLQWCCYDEWQFGEFGLEVCTLLERGDSITVTCFFSWDERSPAGPYALADEVMQHYRDIYTAIARRAPLAARTPNAPGRPVCSRMGDWSRTTGEDTGSYPPYRYDRDDSFFHIDLLHPEDDDQESP